MTIEGAHAGGSYRVDVSAQLREATILVVDDEPANLRVLERLLSRAGYSRVFTTRNPRRVSGLYGELDPDLVLLDLHMPHLDGFAVLEQLQGLRPPGTYLPVLVLTGDADPESRQRALSAGAADFVTKPFDAVEVGLRIRNLLETRHLHQELRRHNERLEDRVRERTRELAEAQLEILQRLALAAEYRDDLTGRHAERVGVLSALLGERVGLDEEEVQLLRRAATLHDVGKIGIPDAILMKPGPLTAEEFEVMKRHTEIGGRILSGSRFPLLLMARKVALHHHDRWDGHGYNSGLAGTEIPLAGRLVAVADVFDSLTHERPYKAPKSVDEAIATIREERARHFDPRVVDAFLELVRSGELDGVEELTVDPLTAPPLPADGREGCQADAHGPPGTDGVESGEDLDPR